MLMTPVIAAGRIEFQHGNTSQAVSYLQEGLHIAEQINKAEDEARLRHRLGLALWHTDQLEAAQDQLEAAAALLETIRHRPGAASNEGSRILHNHGEGHYLGLLHDNCISVPISCLLTVG